MENDFNNIMLLINNLTGTQWVSIVVAGIFIFTCTWLAQKILTAGIEKFLVHDKVPLPSMSIYINIVKVMIWLIGASVLLSTCFNIDVSGVIAALGVGGIAISLGFKDTISNLISGVQVSTCKIMKPGDHVSIGSLTGVVKDTSWRHTTIKDMYGQTIIVPNSIINSSAIIKLKPFQFVRVHVMLHSKSEALVDISNKIIDEVKLAVEKFGPIEDDPKIQFSSIQDSGAKGTISLKMKKKIDGKTAAKIKDCVVKSIAPYVEAAKIEKTDNKETEEKSN